MASPGRSARRGISTPPRSALTEVPPHSQSPRRRILGSKSSIAVVPSPAVARRRPAPSNVVALFRTTEDENTVGKSPLQDDGSRKRGLACRTSSAAPASSKHACTSRQSSPARTAAKPPPPPPPPAVRAPAQPWEEARDADPQQDDGSRKRGLDCQSSPAFIPDTKPRPTRDEVKDVRVLRAAELLAKNPTLEIRRAMGYCGFVAKETELGALQLRIRRLSRDREELRRNLASSSKRRARASHKSSPARTAAKPPPPPVIPQDDDGSRKRGLACRTSSAAPASSKRARISYEPTPAHTAARPPPLAQPWGGGFSDATAAARVGYWHPPPPTPGSYAYPLPPAGGYWHPPPPTPGSYAYPIPPAGGYWHPPPPQPGSYGHPLPSQGGSWHPRVLHRPPLPSQGGSWRPPSRQEPGSYGRPRPSQGGSCWRPRVLHRPPLSSLPPSDSTEWSFACGPKKCTHKDCDNEVERFGLCIPHGAYGSCEEEFDMNSLEIKHLLSGVPIQKRRLFKYAKGHVSGFHTTCLPLQDFQVFCLETVLDDDEGREWYDSLPPERQNRLREVDGEFCLRTWLVNMHGHDYTENPIPHLAREPRASLPVNRQCYVSTDALACLENHQIKDDRRWDYGPSAPNPQFRDKAHFLVFDAAAVATWFTQVGAHATTEGTQGTGHLGASDLPIPVKAAFEVRWNGPTIHTATFRLYFDGVDFLP